MHVEVVLIQSRVGAVSCACGGRAGTEPSWSCVMCMWRSCWYRAELELCHVHVEVVLVQSRVGAVSCACGGRAGTEPSWSCVMCMWRSCWYRAELELCHVDVSCYMNRGMDGDDQPEERTNNYDCSLAGSRWKVYLI